MRKILVIATAAAISASAPGFAQSAGSPGAAPAGSGSNTGAVATPASPSAGATTIGMKPTLERHAAAKPPVGQTAPNGDVAGKAKSGANGS